MTALQLTYRELYSGLADYLADGLTEGRAETLAEMRQVWGQMTAKEREPFLSPEVFAPDRQKCQYRHPGQVQPTARALREQAGKFSRLHLSKREKKEDD